MSVIYLSDTFLQNLAKTLADILNNPNIEKHLFYNSDPLANCLYNCRGGVYKDFQADKIQYFLSRLNFEAYKSVYKCSEFEYAHPDYNARNAINIIYSCGEAGFLKKLECFIYQCDEKINRESPLLKALNDLKISIMHSLIDKIPEYKNAGWLE